MPAYKRAGLTCIKALEAHLSYSVAAAHCDKGFAAMCRVEVLPPDLCHNDWRIKMSDLKVLSRRTLLKFSGLALAAVPILAFAAKNDSMRSSLKYKTSPEGDKQCGNCMQFVPGKTPTSLGSCKILPGDTEISPNAYCVAWVKRA
jgi:hypothetical protein